MIPVSVISFCFACRKKTPHRLFKPPLYACERNCGSPLRHFTNPHSKSPEAIALAKSHAEAVREYWRKESEAAEARMRRTSAS